MELLTGRVTAIAQHHRRATGVVVAEGMIEGDAVVIAMGPWSILAALSLPLPAVFGLKGHSLVFDTGNAVPSEALSIEYREPAGRRAEPRNISARRRHDLCLRHFQRDAFADRSGTGRTRSRGDRAS